MGAKLNSAIALCSVFASTLSVCVPVYGQETVAPAFRLDRPAALAWNDRPGKFGGAFSAIAADGGVGRDLAEVPIAPEPAAGGTSDDWEVPAAGTRHQKAFSRIGIGANVSPLGIGINATTPLSDYFDARVMGNFFNLSVPEFEVEGFRTTADLHLASMAASLDWYPFNSVFRISPGLMFYNGNQISMSTLLVAATSFKLNGQTFYSANPNPATGAVPLSGTGMLGLHTQVPAFTIAGGFGKFVPRSNRHWSFPAEFGVVFMGTPAVNVTTSGWACTDKPQTQCSNVADTANPVGQEFNTQLQAQLTKWRVEAGKVQIYPMFSYSFVYSFNIR